MSSPAVSAPGQQGHGFGTAPVFLASICTILGAIMFLRFGYAVGHLGVAGALAVVVVGHLVTLPTALAIAELATMLMDDEELGRLGLDSSAVHLLTSGTRKGLRRSVRLRAAQGRGQVPLQVPLHMPLSLRVQ